MDNKYTWVPIYKKLAIKLLEYKNNRKELLKIFYEMGEEADLYSEGKLDGSFMYRDNNKPCKFDDIDPFTFLNRFTLIFNEDNTRKLIKLFQIKTGLEVEIPKDFYGIPYGNAQRQTFIRNKDVRKDNDIDDLWDFFEVAIKYPNNNYLEKEFIEKYNICLDKPLILWNLSISLFRINPDFYISLDKNVRALIHQYNYNIDTVPNGEEYIKIIKDIKNIIDNNYNSIVDFTYHAYINHKNIDEMDDENINTWFYAPGENASLWDECQINNQMYLEYDLIGDLNQYKNPDEIEKEISKKYNYVDKKPVNARCACNDFANRMNIGDMVIVKSGAKKILGYGYVTSNYYYNNKRDNHKNVRDVNWVKTGEWENTTDTKNPTKVLTEISQYPGYPEKLLNIINGIEGEEMNYYFVSANPKLWMFSNFKVGETITYTSKNENGHNRQIPRNYVSIKKDDKLIIYESTPKKAIVGLARVLSKDKDNNFTLVKEEQLINPINFNDFKEDERLTNMEFMKSYQGSLFKLEKDEYDCLMDLIRDVNPINNNKADKYTTKDFEKDIYITTQKYNDIVITLEKKKNIILQGAPGVGKTYMAKRIAYSIMGEKNNNRIEFIQFHQSYAYEDFIEGYRPQTSGGFKLENGVFKNMCLKAQNDPNNKYYFIIDEINRGNMSKIFGELLMLIEEDKRDIEKVTLPYSKEEFFVPSNLYIIGLMNTADRSLAILDYALRRRFSFIDITPAFKSPKFINYLESINNKYLKETIEKINKLNEEIKNDPTLGEGFMIGHSYFCGLKNNASKEEIKSIIKYDVLPLIKEYWFDNKNKIEEYKKIFNIKSEE